VSLQYYWGWDVAMLSGSTLTVIVTDSSGLLGANRTFTVSITSGTFAHIDLSSVTGTGTYTAFAAALEAALEAGSALGSVPRTYTVTWSSTTGYTIAVDSGATLTLDLTGSVAQLLMRTILGMAGDRTGALSYSSTRRPYYLLVPATQCRTAVSDEYEPADVVTEEINDSGLGTSEISRDEDEVWLDWTQTAEDEHGLPTAIFDPGTPVFDRHLTAALRWSYQQAWAHHQTSGDPFAVVEGGVTAGSDVARLRAEGSSWEPNRMGSDYDAWSIAFRTRLLGRLT
jgi:hypothetical protein